MNNWIEIFKGGKQTDSAGVTHEDCDTLIDNAVKNFNTAKHEPPVVIGHPNENAPAWGWVSELKSDIKNGAKILYAKLKDVQPAFQELVNKGLYKKRSASFYPDGTLRHLGFLGAVPPAVKGLPDYAFKENGITFEFEEEKVMVTLNQNDQITGVSKPVAAVTTDFSEMEKKIRAEYDAKISALEKQAKRQELTHYAEKLPPAWRESGIVEFMESLDSGVITFSETKKLTPVAWFKDFLENQVNSLRLFGEIATKDKAKKDMTEAEEDDKVAKDIAARVNYKEKK